MGAHQGGQPFIPIDTTTVCSPSGPPYTPWDADCGVLLINSNEDEVYATVVLSSAQVCLQSNLAWCQFGFFLRRHFFLESETLLCCTNAFAFLSLKKKINKKTPLLTKTIHLEWSISLQRPSSTFISVITYSPLHYCLLHRNLLWCLFWANCISEDQK